MCYSVPTKPLAASALGAALLALLAIGGVAVWLKGKVQSLRVAFVAVPAQMFAKAGNIRASAWPCLGLSSLQQGMASTITFGKVSSA